MIDTDKYEGHTPAPWKAMFNHPQVEGSCVVNDEDESNFGWTDGERILGPLWVGELTDDMPDTKLIADAPLLLEEVKRLREEIENQNNVIITLYDMIQHSEEHVELVKALEQGLGLPETWKEMIE
tara:strand:- start:871 stop:1245 length:375 start_codon:yes stop_codon:yes gene_type:complete